MNYNYLIKILLQNQKCLKYQVFRHSQICESRILLSGLEPLNELW